MNNGKITYILGAGFSMSAGLPDQKKMLKLFISYAKSNVNLSIQDKVENEITKLIREFFSDIFGWNETDGATNFPSLEDIFTLIDLSASEGHNLGLKYTPSKLRAMRRFMILKIFCILDRESELDAIEVSSVNDIKNFVNLLNENTNIISLNWDILLENYINKYRTDLKINYGVGSDVVLNEWNDNLIKIAKVHGSSNWVYCDNCKRMSFSTEYKLALKYLSGIYVKDIKEFYPDKFDRPEEVIYILREHASDKKCPQCFNAVGTHIATFSYKKSFRTNDFINTIKNAEKMLEESDEWIFIGYSLPEADYEFKHLLKCAQLRFDNEKRIKVVVREDKNSIDRYKSFFGSKNIVEEFNGGLTEYIKNL